MNRQAKKANAPGGGGVKIDRAGGHGSEKQLAFTDEQFTTDVGLLSNKSTAIEIQERKLLTLLRCGPHTTVELRDHGIMMPGARVHGMRKAGYTIVTEKVSVVDGCGFSHAGVARYRLTAEPSQGD